MADSLAANSQATDSLAIGIDLGATKIAAALVTRQGQLVAERRIDTDASEGSDAVIQRLATMADELIAEAAGPVAGIGIGSPGYVDGQGGIVRNAVNLGWQEVALVARLTHALAQKSRAHVPVWLENDANVQALGELVFGATQGIDNFVHIAIGSGLGGGIVVEGDVLAGASHAVAELGHFSLDPNGRECPCGLRGCFETIVSGPGLVRTVEELRASHANSTLPTTDLQPEGIVAAARAGDGLAQAALAETARVLGAALAIYVATVNPACFVIGGGLGHSAFDLLIPGAEAEIQRRTLPQSYSHLRFVLSQVTSTAVGASALVWHNQR